MIDSRIPYFPKIISKIFLRKTLRWKVSSLIIKIATIYVHDTYIQDTRFDRLIRSTVSRFDRYAIQSNDCVWIKVSLGSLDLEWSAPPPPCHHRSIIGGVNEAVRFPLFPRSVCAGARYRQVSINRRIHVYTRCIYVCKIQLGVPFWKCSGSCRAPRRARRRVFGDG